MWTSSFATRDNGRPLGAGAAAGDAVAVACRASGDADGISARQGLGESLLAGIVENGHGQGRILRIDELHSARCGTECQDPSLRVAGAGGAEIEGRVEWRARSSTFWS